MILIIGFGNELRGDDAVGPAVADAVAYQQWPGVCAVGTRQLTPELAEAVAGASEVYFVDASADPGQASVQLDQITVEPTPAWLGHVSRPADVMALAAAAFGKAPKAWLVTIPGESFEVGTRLSTSAEQGMRQAFEILARRCCTDRDLTPGLR